METNEYGETDRAKIPFILCSGVKVLRTDFRNNVLTYWFPKNEALEVLKGWDAPDMELFRNYVKTMKQVNANYIAFREASKHQR